MKVGVLRFLGTNCDYDIEKYCHTLGMETEFLPCRDHFDESAFDLLVLPGGFSYGDYLRSGALAARTPIISSLLGAVRRGVPVLGICNGFQILCEVGVLPGTLLKNKSGLFIDRWVRLEVVGRPWIIAEKLAAGTEILLPVAHGDGRFFIDEKGLKDLQDQQQIFLRYQEDLNGSVDRIAGITSKDQKILGLMPHPERAFAEYLGGLDGRLFL